MAEFDPIYLISPTEPLALRQIGETSPAVEAKGCDVLILLPKIRIGIQRKTWTDLVSSIDDGRLANSIPKMDMDTKIVLIEGPVQFARDGKMIVRTSRVHAKNTTGILKLRHTRSSLTGVTLSLRYVHGLDVFYTENLQDTIDFVLHCGIYFSKGEHKGLVGRRVFVRGDDISGWGRIDPAARKRAAQINLLMAVGMGQKTAEAFLEATGGVMPISWGITKEQMMTIPRIGEATADKLIKALE